MWKTIEGYLNYQVNSDGRVQSLKFRKIRILKPGRSSTGYFHVVLCRNGKSKICSVHRLVMKAFVGPCPDGMEVNHKNGIKSDNSFSNLEYITKSENHLHAYRTGLNISSEDRGIPKKSVNQFMKDGRFVKTYKSVREAARQLGIWNQNISKCCNRKLKSAGGYCWKFKNI